jgi:hypothetical protein
MPNRVYPKYKQAAMSGGANTNLDTGTVRSALVDLGVYTYSDAHEFLSSVSSAVVGTPQEILNTTVLNGLFDGDNVSYPAVTGNSVEAIVIFIDTGVAATSRLFGFLDTGVTGLPVTPNGGAINITWNASGIIQL